VLDALNGGPMTASEIAKITGIGTGTVSTMLTKMTKSGELAKAQCGYKLPDQRPRQEALPLIARSDTRSPRRRSARGRRMR
jgi:transposase